MVTSILEGALGLAARGMPVIPLRPRSKVPIHSNWPKLGMLDEKSIRMEWTMNPLANVGVVCGHEALNRGGLVVVDVDGWEGCSELAAMQLEHGDLPTTSTLRTPHQGFHYYYRGHAISWNPAPGVEVRSDGRQCAAPPSVLPDGEYTWTWDCGFAELPDWLKVPVRAPAREPRTFVPSGLRDPVLDVSPPVYFERLCGLTPNRHGFVPCPIHQELEASCRVYDTAERGWFCYGETCRRGGDVVTLVAELGGIPTPVRGSAFLGLLDYLAGRLL